MAGLMQQGSQGPQQQPQQPMLKGQQGVAPEADYEGEANATPEEQAAYEKFVNNGLGLIANEKMAPEILKRIKQADTPAEGLASVTVNVIRRLEQSAKENGRQIDPAILLHGGTELMEAIAQMATAFGIHQFDEKQIESAAFIAMDQYGTQALGDGSLNQEALAQDMHMLQQADQDGSLDDLFGEGFTEQAGSLQVEDQ